MPIVVGSKQERRPVFIQYDGNGARGHFQRCIIEDGYKLIIDMFKDESFVELYHIVDDPQEQVNLARNPAYGDILSNLLKQLKQHMSLTNDLISIPEAVLDRLKSNC
jgi:arylsulfatase A-like enzyme